MIDMIAFFIWFFFKRPVGSRCVVTAEDVISKLASLELSPILTGEWNSFSIILTLGLFDFDVVLDIPLNSTLDYRTDRFFDIGGMLGDLECIITILLRGCTKVGVTWILLNVLWNLSSKLGIIWWDLLLFNFIDPLVISSLLQLSERCDWEGCMRTLLTLLLFFNYWSLLERLSTLILLITELSLICD